MKKLAFSSNLRRLLDQRSLTLTEVSVATGIPVSTLSEWTAGREPKVSSSLLKLTEFLEVTLDQLVFITEAISPQLRSAESTVFVELEGHKYELKLRRVIKGPS